MKIGIKYKVAYGFSGGFARVSDDEAHWYYINKSGVDVWQKKYSWCEDFSESLAAVKIDGLFGFIDTRGELVIPAIFEECRSFSEGLAAVRLPGDGNCENYPYWYIKPSGEVFLKTTLFDVDDFSDGLASFRRGVKCGYMDMSGNVIIEPRFDRAANFENGYALVTFFKPGAKRWEDIFLIDRNGCFLFDAPMACIFRPDSKGYVGFKSETGCGFMDKSGRVLFQEDYDRSEFTFEFAGELASFYDRKSERFVYFNRNGMKVWPRD